MARDEDYEGFVKKARGIAPDKNDPPKLNRGKDKDKPSRPQQKTWIEPELFRDENGELRVRYVEVNTGQPMKGQFRDYKVDSNASTLDDIFDLMDGFKPKKKKSKEERDKMQGGR